MSIILDLLNWTGISDVSGGEYAAWSGILSDVGEVAIIGGLISIYRKHNCHVKSCWRIGRYPVEGTVFTTCRRHHPTASKVARVTADHIWSEHIKAKKEKQV